MVHSSPILQYLGSFSVDMAGGWKSDFAKTVKHQLSKVNPKVNVKLKSDLKDWLQIQNTQ